MYIFIYVYILHYIYIYKYKYMIDLLLRAEGQGGVRTPLPLDLGSHFQGCGGVVPPPCNLEKGRKGASPPHAPFKGA